jgi:magnesium transporter
MQVAELDFASREELVLSEEAWPSQPGQGKFYLIAAGPEEVSEQISLIGRIGADPVPAAALREPRLEARYELFDDAIYFTLTEVCIDGTQPRFDVQAFLLGGNFLAVLAEPASALMIKVQGLYREDFRKFAKSSGFLLYEFGSQFLESYRHIFLHYTAQAERIQVRLFGKVTDDIFAEVSRLTSDILAFRRTVLSARDLFNDLATRRSALVPESTQPALDILSDRMERLGGDIAAVRSVLNESLNFYMGMVSHRTNKIVNRLTIISMIFLPLSFLAGVYGMNFRVEPELDWQYSYLAFWIIVIVFIASFLVFVRKKKWI